MKTDELAKLLKNKIIDFSSEIDGLNCEFNENKKIHTYKIYGKLTAIEFVYTKKDKMMWPGSMLFCRVYLGKNSEQFYHFPELMGELGPEDFRSWYFPYIENEERLDNCFAVLTDLIKEYLPKIDELALDVVRRKEVEEKIWNARIKLMKVEEKDIPESREEREMYFDTMQDFCECMVYISRFSIFNGYQYFVSGEYDKAIKQYDKLIKKDSMTEYEQRLYSFMEAKLADGETKGYMVAYEAMPLECNSAAVARKHKGGKENFKMGCAYFLVGYVVCTAFFIALIAIANLFIHHGTVYVSGMNWYWGFLWGATPGIFFGLAFRRKITELFMKHKKKEILEFDEILNTEKSNGTVEIMFYVFSIFTIVMLIAILQMSIRFYDDHMMYDSGYELFAKDVRYDYADIEEIYLVDGLYNDYGDWIDRSHYMLKLKDETIVDLDMVAPNDVMKQKILPLFEEYASEIQHVKSEEEVK